LSEVIGRPIAHQRISFDQLEAGLKGAGLNEDVIEALVAIRMEMADGVENVPDNGEFQKLVGRPPLTFKAWAEKNKSTWM
jgi:hypothetical protein